MIILITGVFHARKTALTPKREKYIRNQFDAIKKYASVEGEYDYRLL